MLFFKPNVAKLESARDVRRLREALRHADPLIRGRAAGALGRVGGREATSPLCAALADVSPVVREASARALGALRVTEALDPLIAALSDTAASVRVAAVLACESLGSERVVGPLVQCFEDASPDVAREAIRVVTLLAKQSAWRIADVLSASARLRSETTATKAWTIAVDTLNDAVDHAADASTERGHEELGGALFRMSRAPGGTKLLDLLDHRASPALAVATAIDLWDNQARKPLDERNVLWAALCNRVTAPIAKRLLFDAADTYYRDSPYRTNVSLWPLVAIMSPEDFTPRMIDALRSRLCNGDVEAVAMLGHAGGDRAFRAVVEGLGSSKPLVRQAAAETLVRSKQPAAIEPLLATLNDEDLDVRIAAAGVTQLLDTNDPRAKPEIDRLLDELITPHKEPANVPVLVQNNETEWRPGPRVNAARRLGRLVHPASVEALSTWLRDDPHSEVRHAAASALACLGDRAAVDPLIEALARHPSDVVLVVGLGMLGDSRALEAVVRFKDSIDATLYGWHRDEVIARLAAGFALERFNAPAAETARSFLGRLLPAERADLAREIRESWRHSAASEVWNELSLYVEAVERGDRVVPIGALQPPAHADYPH